MIGSLRGTLQFKGLDRLIVDVGGVGYLVSVSSQTLAQLPQEGEEAQIVCYTHVREDAIQIFGFARAEEKQLFELLISVSGIGPKLALAMLSGMPVEELVGAITAADHKRIQAVPGVGKKTAERVVVDLKDKCAKVFTGAPAPGAIDGGPDADVGDVVDALVGLGYKRSRAEKVARLMAAKAGSQATPEEVLRRTLAALMEA